MKIITPSEWNQHFSTEKAFSENFPIKAYSYYDYMHAWEKTLLVRSQSHTWFIYFCKSFASKFKIQNIPTWWLSWWTNHGPTTLYFPSAISEAYKLFCNNSEAPEHQNFLGFCVHFKLSFIICWQYEYVNTNTPLPALVRRFKYKWWDKFDHQLANRTAVISFLQSHGTQNIKLSTQDDFAASKAQKMAKLAAAQTQEEFDKIMQDHLSAEGSIHGESKEKDEDEDEYVSGYTPLNEDDCYGIFSQLQ